MDDSTRTDDPTEEEERIAAEMGGEPDDEPPGEDAERKTLADLAAEEPDAEDEREQFTLFGTAPKVNTKVSGGRVSSSHVKFKAKQQDLPGQFQMGDVITLAVKARVDKLEFVQTHDGDGNVTSTKRLHTMTALKVEQMGHVAEEFAEVDGRSSAFLKQLTAALEDQGVSNAADVALAAIEATATEEPEQD